MHSSASTTTLRMPFGRIRRNLVTLGIAALAAGAIVGGSAGSASASAEELGGTSTPYGCEVKKMCELSITSAPA